MECRAIATWTEDGWWAIEVPDVPMGHTQAKRFADVVPTVRDLVAALLDVAEDDVTVTVYPVGAVAGAVQVARDCRKAAERAENEAHAQERATVWHLHTQGLTGRDIADLMGRSTAWVSAALRVPSEPREAAA